jgi:GH15 family glucan-1,4-alpha-glucosidase
MTQRPIESCGVIGDLHTVALVAMDGTIDWCCLPQFDSPSVFAAILDENIGGHFRLAPLNSGTNRQMYMPETNVLLTRFLRAEGVGEVIDFMPVQNDRDVASQSVMHEIVRIARAVRGAVQFRLECAPAFNYARTPHTATAVDGGVLFRAGQERMLLLGPGPWQIQNGVAATEFTLQPNETAEFALRYLSQADDDRQQAPVQGKSLMDRTLAFWREWLSHCTYEGRWRENVLRSALTLKMLTHHPTGAIVAAPTTSLPESIGGERNWDYRYTWIRDSSFTVYTLIRLGFTEEATAFMEWLAKRIQQATNGHSADQPKSNVGRLATGKAQPADEASQEKNPEHNARTGRPVPNDPLNVMYSVEGKADLTEITLDHFSGYRDSRPVRIGNAAYNQLQLDIYGEMMDSIYLYDKHVSGISYDTWQRVKGVLEWVADNWNQPDDGMWEVRSERQNFVYSKMQCWVALDRGLRLAEGRSLPIDRARMEHARDDIFESIMKNGWNTELQSFVQAYESSALDAGNLLMPTVFFVAPTDPRMLSTIDRTMEKLVSDSLVYRYQLDDGKAAWDGLTGAEGTFSMCTFWLVDALARANRLEEARFIFEKMLTYANHLGLYSEEISSTGIALGNFPQAFTHLGLISAALHLDRKLRK